LCPFKLGSGGLNDFLEVLSGKKPNVADLLVSLGSPRAMETLSVLPAGLRAGKSESPGAKVKVRVPPPPHPSFFTATVILKGSTETRFVFLPVVVRTLSKHARFHLAFTRDWRNWTDFLTATEVCKFGT